MKKNFTLVELLTVIAIISILAALLLSAMNKSRNKAIQITCANNNRQLQMAFMQYTSNSDGFFPPYYPNWFGGRYSWVKNLVYHRYVTNAELLVCSEVARMPYGTSGGNHLDALRIYVDRLLNDERGLDYQNFAGNRISYGYNWAAFGRNKEPARNNRIRHPSQTILLAENKRHDPDVKDKEDTSSFIVSPKSREDYASYKTFAGYIWPRHDQKRLAVGWADGHATLEQVPTLDPAKIYDAAPFAYGGTKSPEEKGYAENNWDL